LIIGFTYLLMVGNGLCKNRFETELDLKNKNNNNQTKLIRTTDKMVFTLCYKL
jgi:hypothetical protein